MYSLHNWEVVFVCTFIGIESLVANALIELFDYNHTREITFDTLVEYGMKVVQIYQRETGEEAVLLLSEKYQLDMVENYSDYFTVNMDAAGKGTLKLKETVQNTDELRNFFRWTLSMKLIDAFMNPEALKKLGVSA